MSAILERTATLTIARERAHGLWAEIVPLLTEHWSEVITYRDIPLDPDVDTYNALEDADRLRVYTVRVDGELVAYAIFIVGTVPHHRTSKQAAGDGIYVRAPYRTSAAGIRLLAHAQDALKAEGVEVIYCQAPMKHPAFGAVLVASGYTPTHTVYSRRL